ncbi:hypothetical protein L208DRAFT_1379982 [Tricholoma matsutake]|nr:hypothetical protein L208DRAFT_1379982 [Tricholoma matsutake 945]
MSLPATTLVAVGTRLPCSMRCRTTLFTCGTSYRAFEQEQDLVVRESNGVLQSFLVSGLWWEERQLEVYGCSVLASRRNDGAVGSSVTLRVAVYGKMNQVSNEDVRQDAAFYVANCGISITTSSTDYEDTARSFNVTVLTTSMNCCDWVAPLTNPLESFVSPKGFGSMRLPLRGWIEELLLPIPSASVMAPV